jgi:glycosyltransferase involved in cell wall biosynthesis
VRILVLTEYFPTAERAGITGGVESRALHLLKEVAKRHDVTVLCSYQEPMQPRHQVVAGVEVRRVGPRHPYANDGHLATRLGFAVVALVYGAISPAFDIVEGFSYVAYPVAALLGRVRRRPTIATVHESWSLAEWVRLKGPVTGALGAVWTRLGRELGFDRYVAVSAATKQRLVAQGVPAHEIAVVHNGVDVDVMRAVPGSPGPRPSVVASMRLVRSKRADVLIRAIAEVKRHVPDILVTVHGEGAERAALGALCAELGLQEHVRFEGRVSRFEDVLALRKRHHVVCLPSASEGFGMVVIESMALGVPVVCTDIPVLREVTAGAGALHFRLDHHLDLAEKLRLLLSDGGLRAELGRQGRARAEAFAWPRLAEAMEREYKAVAADAVRSSGLGRRSAA